MQYFVKEDEKAGDLEVDMTSAKTKPYSERQLENAWDRAQDLYSAKTTEWEHRLESHQYVKKTWEIIKGWVNASNI